jgi:hypothetical protein
MGTQIIAILDAAELRFDGMDAWPKWEVADAILDVMNESTDPTVIAEAQHALAGLRNPSLVPAAEGRDAFARIRAAAQPVGETIAV